MDNIKVDGCMIKIIRFAFCRFATLLNEPMQKKLYHTLLFIVLSANINAQTSVTVSKPNYPYVKAYMSFIIPCVTFNKDETVTQFEKATTIGFPVGLNVYY